MPRKKIAKTAEKEASLKTDVYNLKGEVVGKIQLPLEIFAAKASPQLIAQAVRVYQANERLGTVSTKTRSEVAGSTRKIYRQKGTGRARHGSITAPIFIGGGVAHGPKPKDFSLNLPQKMKRAALFGILAEKWHNGEVKIVRGLEKIELKTKKMNETLVNLKLTNAKDEMTKILLVTSENFRNIRLAARNIENLSLEDARRINTYQVISNKNIILMEEAVPVLAGHFFPQEKPKESPQISVKQTKKPVSQKSTSKKKVTKKPVKREK